MLDLATTAPGWPNSSVGVDGSKARVDSDPIPCKSSTGKVEKQVGQANSSIGMCLLKAKF